MKNMQTEVYVWHDSTCYVHGSGHIPTLQYLKNTFMCLELLERGWNFETEFASFLKFFVSLGFVLGGKDYLFLLLVNV